MTTKKDVVQVYPLETILMSKEFLMSKGFLCCLNRASISRLGFLFGVFVLDGVTSTSVAQGLLRGTVLQPIGAISLT